MKKLITVITTVAIASSISLTACSNLKEEPENIASEPVETISEPVATTSKPESEAVQQKEETESEVVQQKEKDAYLQQLTFQLQEHNSKIAKLQNQEQQAQVAEREKFNEQVTELIKKLQARSQLNAELDQEMAELLKQLPSPNQPNSQMEQLFQQQEVLRQNLEKIEKTESISNNEWESLKVEIDKANKDLPIASEELVDTKKAPAQ